jgi:4-diphosphocytidyl-2-C-methyl-D-erythritol kinase
MGNKNMISRGWPAPAKLNLFLHITGRREDGYHLLQTVFQLISYCDLLDFTLLNNSNINRLSVLPGVPEEADLVIRAARKLQELTGCSQGTAIHVKKCIPTGGGLGGGSSDAATTLIALNQLWQLSLTVDELADIGLQLGADVPVFVRGRAAWAEGVGEKLTPLKLPEYWYLVIRPDCSVSTKEVFNSGDLTRSTPPITIRDFLAGDGRNDCESVVLKSYPKVAEALDWLNEFGIARVTGTGACIYASFNDEGQARETIKKLPASWQGFVAKGRNYSPLFDRLKHEIG